MEAEHSFVLKCLVKQLILKHAWGSEKIAGNFSDTNALSPRRCLCCPEQYRMELLLAFYKKQRFICVVGTEGFASWCKVFSSLCSDCWLELTLVL